MLNIALSLDGFIAGQNGEYDWCFTDQDYGMKEFFTGIDTVLMGRKTYETLHAMDPKLYHGMKNYIFSKSLEEKGPGRDLFHLRRDKAFYRDPYARIRERYLVGWR